MNKNTNWSLLGLMVVSLTALGAYANVPAPTLTLSCQVQETQLVPDSYGGMSETVLASFTVAQPMPLISQNWAHANLSGVSQSFPEISFTVGSSGAPNFQGQSTFVFGLSFKDSKTDTFTNSDGEAVLTLGTPASADGYSGEFKVGNNTISVSCGIQ
jgi:hypothetical protein